MISVYFQGLWTYLKQPLFDPEHPVRWRVQPFLQQQQLQFLKDCWQLETAVDNLLFEQHPTLSLLHQIIHLERCWNFKKQRSYPTLVSED